MSQPMRSSLPQDLSNALSDHVAHTAQSVVSIHSNHSRSSGFLWRPDLIVTADEALAEDGGISVTLPGGKIAPAAVVGRDPTTDIALLRIDRVDLAPVALQYTPVRVGTLALAMGSRQGAPIVAFGAVSFVGEEWHSLRGGEIDARIELDLPLRGISEGGLTVDASGGPFGMAVFGLRRQVLVIPATTVERVAGKLQTHGRIPRGYLGVGLQPIKLDGDKGNGFMVMSVEPNGPAATAGLQQGDVIIKWDEQGVRDLHSLVRALGPSSVGSIVKLVLRRSAAPLETTLTIAERPEI